MGSRLLVLTAAVGLVLAGAACGEETPSPEEVVRAWSMALNGGENDAAAELFAENATIVQGDFYARLPTHEAALAFNESLPCSGEIVELRVEGDQVIATFVLGDRPASPCDGPGQRATALFVVEDGMIVLWQQVPTPGAPGEEPPAGGGEGPSV